jgi:PmbA protein
VSIDRRLTDAFERHPAVHDWTVRRQLGRGVQVYLVGNQIESVRQIERESYEVELYNDHTADGEPSRGAAKVPVSRADLERLPELLETATTMARLVNNPTWSLPEPHDMPEVELADPALTDLDGALAAAHEAADRIRALAANEAPNDVRLSAAELFVTTVEEELENSRGLVGSMVGTHLLLEITLLARQGHEEAEYFRQAAARRMADLRIDETVTEGSRMARDKLRATAPQTRVGPVVISGEALAQFFGGNAVTETGALLSQASAAMAYTKISRLEVGRPIWGDREPQGDLLTLHANARLPYGVASYRFDADGVAAQDLPVIQDGVLRARPASQRYAQYLDLPVSGRPGMAEIKAGTTPLAELMDGDGPVYHVVAFSAPNVDELTGDFGMEIRVGYERDADGVRPLTGGSVTGNLFEALADVRLSSETRVNTSYAGPVAMRFGSLQVAGRD